MWLRVYAYALAVCLLVAPTLADVCPENCVCNTTRDGLHRVTCSNLAELYKYTLRQKHHNINILDLSHNNITKVSHELDRLTEVVTLDLSTNGITKLNKFLHNAKKLVHLNLANNRIQTLSLTNLPTSVSSLDLTNNLLQDVPSDFEHLKGLEHLELEGNPLNCSCENIAARDRLLRANVVVDKVKCAFPEKVKGRSWLELKTKDICKFPKTELNYLDMMMGDQPVVDAEEIGEQSTALKSMPLVAKSDLDDGEVLHDPNPADDDDSKVFLKVDRSTLSPPSDALEGSGSGDIEFTTVPNLIEPRMVQKIIPEDQEFIPVENDHTTEDPFEASGQGSGSGGGVLIFPDEDYVEPATETTEPPITTPVTELEPPGPVKRIFDEDNSTEFPMPERPSVFKGDLDWDKKTESPAVKEDHVTPQIARDTTVSEHIRVTQPSNLGAAPTTTEKVAPHKTGTYVCIAIIVVLLVGLIGFAIVKGQMRKRRDRRLLRQQKRDVEKASKEMVDMNKSLLGKPAGGLESPIERKVNGKYELVPTHEVHQKKSENGDVGNGIKYGDNNDVRTDSPRDTNQNKSSSKDNNLSDEAPVPQQETSFESDLASPDSRKDTNSLSSEDIFVPINDDETPRLNGNLDLDVSQPLINGDQITDSDFLSPSREYVPVYSPDMGRVRIKMSETPKPKTPVLVNRSRSNAGDIIITPSDGARKSTT